MKIEEIFTEIANHMEQGILFHKQLINYYSFLNLKGYKKCQEFHYLEQINGYKELQNYYISHYKKLIDKKSFQKEDVIPKSWYGHTKNDLSSQLKRQSIQNGMEIWIDWQTRTRKLYQRMYQELVNIGEISTAFYIQKYVCDVDEQLREAEEEYLNMKALDFDMSVLIPQQKELYKDYKKRIQKIFN